MQAIDLICFKCKHFDSFGFGCKAFPEGIPEEITSGQDKHKEPLPNQDNDIVFEKDDQDGGIKIV